MGHDLGLFFLHYSRIYARILMKFQTKVNKIVVDDHIKFREDPSFRCGDICKTNWRLFNPSFSMYFSYFHNLSTKVPPKFEKYDKCLGHFACV